MKLTTLILFTVMFQVSATTFAQKITLSEKKVSIEKVFDKISTQTGYDFLFTRKTLNGIEPVTIEVKNMDLADVLKMLFNGLPLSSKIEDKSIVISRKQPALSGNLKAVQQIPGAITGIVVDSTGKPIRGVTVSISRSEIPNPSTNSIMITGTITDAKGGFTIANLAAGEYNLTITSVGYQKIFKIIKVSEGGIENLGSFILKPAVSQLNEVSVNTGYQLIKPEQSTGAVAKITTKEYEVQMSTDFLSGLVNKLPGLVINNDAKFTSTNSNGIKTSNSLFSIRGISTITANQSPLIVVDGYPTELTLDMIDPNEIKSVSILKDAAAATIYGVRASNGVIIIERKRAGAGAPQFSFRTTTGITPKDNYSRYRWDPNASAIDVNYERSVYQTSVSPSTWSSLPTYSYHPAYPAPFYIMAQQAGDIITANQANKSFAALENYNNANDYRQLLEQTATTSTYNLDISGGSPDALYYITSNYTRSQPEQINNSSNNILLSGRTTLKFSKRFSLDLTTDYQEGHKNAAPVPDINNLYPYEHLQDANGNPLPVNFGSMVNPYYNAMIMSGGLEDALYYPLVDVNQVSDKIHTVNNRITANFDYKIGYGLNLTFGGVYETSRMDLKHYASELSSEARQYIDTYATTGADGSTVFNIPKGGFLQQQTASTSSYTVRTQLNYNKQIATDHSINAILGTEVRDLTNKSSSAAYFGYDDQTLLQQPVDYSGIGNGSLRGPIVYRGLNYSSLFNQLYTDDRYVSAYSNIVYAFRDTYSLTGSMRIDQSNLFGSNPKYQYKPLWSVGTAWNIHKEHFMRDIDWVKQLKLRAAYGFDGNVAKNSLPQVIAQSYVNTLSSTPSTALGLLSYANSSLRWEQTKNLNAGLDFGIFKSITGILDYYKKQSTDLLATANIDPTIGVSPSLINSASINNTGIEASLHADWITTNKFNWNTGFVFSRNTSKVLNVAQIIAQYDPGVLNAAGYYPGYPVGAIFAYRSAGLDAAGYPQVKDTQGHTYSTANDLVHLSSDTAGTIRYMGSSIPTINAGLSNRIDIGDFYFYFKVDYYGGFKVQVPAPDPSLIRPFAGAGNYWQKPGDEKTTDVMALAAYSSYGATLVYNNQDKNVVNGDYVTLSDITASYSFNKSAFFKKIGFSHFEIKLQASNVITKGFNKYNYSLATGSYAKAYVTPTYTMGLFTNF